MFSIFAKTGTIQATAPLATAVFICMTGPTTKQAGSFKKTTNNRKDRDGRELTTQNLPRNRIRKNYSKPLNSTVHLNHAKAARNRSKILFNSSVDISTAKLVH